MYFTTVGSKCKWQFKHEFVSVFKMLKQNQEKRIPDDFYNHFHSILRHFDVLPNSPFATSETMCDYYYYKHGIY